MFVFGRFCQRIIVLDSIIVHSFRILAVVLYFGAATSLISGLHLKFELHIVSRGRNGENVSDLLPGHLH